jgi:hypothetical protein
MKSIEIPPTGMDTPVLYQAAGERKLPPRKELKAGLGWPA